jgi:hypothetical protein
LFGLAAQLRYRSRIGLILRWCIPQFRRVSRPMTLAVSHPSHHFGRGYAVKDIREAGHEIEVIGACSNVLDYLVLPVGPREGITFFA